MNITYLLLPELEQVLSGPPSSFLVQGRYELHKLECLKDKWRGKGEGRRKKKETGRRQSTHNQKHRAYLSHSSIAGKRYHDHGNSYRSMHSIGSLLIALEASPVIVIAGSMAGCR